MTKKAILTRIRNRNAVSGAREAYAPHTIADNLRMPHQVFCALSHARFGTNGYLQHGTEEQKNRERHLPSLIFTVEGLLLIIVSLHFGKFLLLVRGQDLLHLATRAFPNVFHLSLFIRRA